MNELLICTLISEDQGLEKSRSASNFRKISGPANLVFFLVSKKLDLCHKPKKNPGDKLIKNPGVQDLEFFEGFKLTLIFQDLDFQKCVWKIEIRWLLRPSKTSVWPKVLKFWIFDLKKLVIEPTLLKIIPCILEEDRQYSVCSSPSTSSFPTFKVIRILGWPTYSTHK